MAGKSTPGIRNGTTLCAALFVLAICSWNVRGLGSPDTAVNDKIRSERLLKRELLGNDCERYGMDVVGLQETKCTSQEDIMLHNNYRLLIFDQKEQWHGGIGFMISPKMQPFITTYKQISDRVGYIDFCLPLKGGGNKNFRIINSYGLTSLRAQQQPDKLLQFYRDLHNASLVPSKWEMFHCGDFNSKLGKRTRANEQLGLEGLIGRHGIGTRNENGEHLLEFMVKVDLTACNTLFDHPSRHKLTWTGEHRTKKNTPIYAQLDYVLCRRRSKVLITDSRSYGGAELRSDHKPVVTRLKMKNHVLLHKNKKPGSTQFDCSTLYKDKELKQKYQSAIAERLSGKTYPEDPNEKMNEIFNDIRACAEQTIPLKEKAHKLNYSSDVTVASLVAKKREQTLKIKSAPSGSDVREDRKEVRKIQSSISKRLVQINNMKADALAEEINSTDDARKMFEASRSLAGIKKSGNIVVNDNNNNPIGTDLGKANTAKDFFKKQLTEGVDAGLQPFTCDPKPLDIPITQAEVAFAASKLKSNRASGPDNLQNELLKYAHPITFEKYAEAINESFSENKYISSIGQGIVTPLQKPGKPKGPLTSLRPLTLLNGSRKMLTQIALKRIESKIDNYTMPWQSAYKRGRSCSDIVWAQRMLISVVMRKEWTFSKMGIDMSRAFDTVKRENIINVLKDAGCDEDDIRLVQYLLSNTFLRVRVNSTLSEEFESLLGAFQGDSLSGKLFTLILAAALHHLRAVSGRPNPPVSELGFPTEWEYSDDCDFADEDIEKLRTFLPAVKEVLKDWNLEVNETKTEFSTVYLAKQSDRDANNQPIVNNEPWRSNKSLGSLLCSEKDIQRRRILAEVAFKKFEKVWLSGKKISLERKLRLYDAQVVSVLLYNSNSWSPKKATMDKIDTLHRRHLRSILNIKWPKGMISNKALYERCKVEMLSKRIEHQRWKMFGHILRSMENTPAQTALSFAIESDNLFIGRLGRPRMNLLSVLRTDLSNRNLHINNLHELNEIKDIAACNKCWENLFQGYSLPH